MTMAVKSTKQPRSPSGKNRQKELLERVNLPKIICIHLVGENHTVHHRMGAGVIVMGFGVLISKAVGGIYIISFLGEVIGYLIHGIGSIPFVEYLNTYLASATKPAEVVEKVGEEEEVEA